MIDYIVLSANTPFAVIMQMHGSWMGLVQRYILESMQCIGFSRLEAKVWREDLSISVMLLSLPRLLRIPAAPGPP